jgi:uncharacterized membrane protein YciS (DUF1049 family)
MEERMFNHLQSASDDQTAVGFCILALSVSAFFVFVSFHLGPAGRKLKELEQKKSESRKMPSISTEPYRSHERAA